jgi:very-short-patch-repair endonuclease
VVEDAAVARTAVRQEGVVTIEQLTSAGLSRNAIRHRVEHHLLQRLWRGVYLLGPLAPGPLALAMAAILTCRQGAVLSYRWAAAVWGFAPYPDVPVDVTVAAGSHRGRRQVRVHRTSLIDRRDFTRRRNLPITTPARTLLDLAAVLDSRALEAAVAEAQVLRLVTFRQLQAILARAGRHPGALKLRRALDHGPGLTRSQYERILRRIAREAGLPQPRTNAKIGRWEVDFHWPDAGLIVEVDPYSTHGHSRAFEKDHRKGAELTAMGYRVMGFTDRQLTNEPLFVAATLAAALAVQSSSSTAGAFARRTSDSMPLAGSGREK